MYWGEMKHMLVTGIAEERPAFQAGSQRAGIAADAIALGDPLADFQAPMGIEIVHDPVEAFHL